MEGATSSVQMGTCILAIAAAPGALPSEWNGPNVLRRQTGSNLQGFKLQPRSPCAGYGNDQRARGGGFIIPLWTGDHAGWFTSLVSGQQRAEGPGLRVADLVLNSESATHSWS